MSGQQRADLLLAALLCDLHKFRFFDEHAADVSHDVIVDLYQLIVWYQHDKSHRDLFEIRIFKCHIFLRHAHGKYRARHAFCSGMQERKAKLRKDLRGHLGSLRIRSSWMIWLWSEYGESLSPI